MVAFFLYAVFNILYKDNSASNCIDIAPEDKSCYTMTCDYFGPVTLNIGDYSGGIWLRSVCLSTLEVIAAADMGILCSDLALRVELQLFQPVLRLTETLTLNYFKTIRN